MPLDRVHAQDEATSDLTVGGTLKQQSQHVALALGERFCKWTGASRGGRKSRGLLLTESCQQTGNVIRDDAAHIGMGQKSKNRWTLTDKKPKVALRFGEHRRRSEGGTGTRSLPLCSK